MRLVTYEHEGDVRVGVRTPQGVIPTPFEDILDLIKRGEEGGAAVRSALPHALPLATYRLLAPIPMPGKILCSGINYRSHLEENPQAVLPSYPHFFAKLPSAVIGPQEAIVIPEPHSQVDYEVELAVVIGKTARKISEVGALDYVFGYTIINDVSGRDIQFTDNQITTGKGLDTFCPLGPEIVLRDEISDPAQLIVASYVNGERRQYSTTADMLFSVEKLLAFLSAHITLYPGDIVTTGTPAGVGCFRQPPTYLQPGDQVEVEVDQIGRLANTVVAGW